MHAKIKVSLLLLVMSVGMVFWPLHAKATTGLVYLSPSGPSVQSGNNVTLSLRINPGTAIDSVQATVNFSASALQVNTVDTSSSSFSTQLQKTVGSSSITVVLGSLGGTVSSDSSIASISFKALSSSGSTSVTLSGVNAAYSGAYTNPSTANATVSFTAAPSSGGSSGGSSKTTTKKSTTTTTTPTTTQPTTTTTTPAVVPKIDFSTKSIQYSLANVSVSSDVPVQAAIQFGFDQKKLDHTTLFTDLGKTHDIRLDSSQLTPGTTYYYEIITKDAAGNTTTSTIKSFKTKGYTIKVTVLDSKYHPVANKTVTLHSTPTVAKTDEDGIATFTDVAPGQHGLEYSLAKDQIFKKDIYVENNVSTTGNNQKVAEQSLAVVLAGLTVPTSHALKYFLTFIAALFITASLGLLIYITPLRKLLIHSTAIIDHPKVAA